MNAMIESIWGNCSPREKTLLSSGVILLLLALIYGVLWEPGASGRQRLLDDIPQLQTQLAQMTRQAEEAHALQSGAQGVPVSGTALRDALASSLAQRGLQTAQLNTAGQGFQLQLKNVNFADYVGWLDEIRRADKVQIVDAHVSVLPSAGQVDVSATLQSVSR